MTCIPLIFAPRLFFNGFQLPQTLALGLLSTVGVVLALGRGFSIALGPSSIFLLLFLISLFISFLRSNPIHNGRKELGLQLPLIIMFFIFVVFLKEEQIKWITLAVTIMTFLCSVYARFQTLGIDPFFPNTLKAGGPKTNAIGTIGNPNFLASFLCIAVWFAVYSYLEFGGLCLVSAFVTLFVLLKTNSRAGLLGFIFSFVFFLLVCSYYDKLPFDNDLLFHSLLAMLVFGFFLIVNLLIMNWNTFFYKEIDPRGEQVWYASFRYRICYWIVAFKMFLRKPFFGSGLWSYRKDLYQIQGELSEKDIRFLNPKRYLTPQPREVHNDYLEHLVEYGLVGTVIFLLFVGSLFYYGFSFLSQSNGIEFFKMLILLSGLTAILIDAVFFFALRNSSTAILFWIICSLIVVKSNIYETVMFSGNWFVASIIGLFLLCLVYDCIGKRSLASYHFLMSMKHAGNDRRIKHLYRAIDYAPYDTIYRTHACIASLDHAPSLSALHAIKMLECYDGMTPLWACYFNVGLAFYRIRNWFDVIEIFFKNSHFMLPTFKPTLDFLNSKDGVGVRSRYKGGRAIMRIAEDGIIWRIKALLGDVERCKMQMKLHDMQLREFELQKNNIDMQLRVAMSEVDKVIMHEKKRLNIPDGWIYDADKGEFLDPNAMSEEDRNKYMSNKLNG